MRSKSILSDLVGRILFILVLSCLLGPDAISAKTAKSADDCIDCHAEVWQTIKAKIYAHRPDRDGDCKYCHIALREAQGGKGSEENLDKVKWVVRGVSSDKEHWLEFEADKRGASLLLETRSGGRLKVKEFPLPAFDELEELFVNDQVPPTISKVRLLGVTRGVFVSAIIAWETDALADSQVFYGFDRLDQSSMLDRRPVTNHVVSLTGVQPGKTYKYKVVSVDLAGNRVESATQSVVVEGGEPEIQEQVAQPGVIDPEVNARFYRRGNKNLVVVSSDQAVSVRLGVMPKKYSGGSSGEQLPVIRHLPLNTPAVTNIGICYSCHVEYEKILSHPINVYPKRGMIIPPEYATLADGRITCMSCHANHASNFEYRLIKDRKEDLCRGCHQDIR